MSTTTQTSKKTVCYRCRNSAFKNTKLIACNHCPLFWHFECISPSLESVPVGEWMCPRHQKPSKRYCPSRKRVAKIKAREATSDSNQEADGFLKYGGVLHNMLAETIEGDFLNYAKRYRQFNRPERNAKRKRVELQAEKWLDSLTCFQFYETNHNGIQMLIDAANVSSVSSDKVVNLNETQLKKFEAIQELVNLKGEGELLEMLSKT